MTPLTKILNEMEERAKRAPQSEGHEGSYRRAYQSDVPNLIAALKRVTTAAEIWAPNPDSFTELLNETIAILTGEGGKRE